jgi:hypothetical protein
LIYALKERIGDPSIFCGRNKEMTLLMNWVNKIPLQRAKSKALLGRRKSGKTAIMERLFNILWNQHERRIVPFYYEVKDQNTWLLHFADDYIRTCLTQYISFLTRSALPLNREVWDWDVLLQKAETLNNHSIIKRIDLFHKYYNKENEHQAINIAVGTPYWFCGEDGYNFVIMIDEIQYMTKYIYKDKEETIQAYNLPGIFHGMVELKFCPMLVSGSYIGWMTRMMEEMFVGGRLKNMPISSSLTFDEGMTAVYKYAVTHEIELSEQNAIAINILTQSNPYYMSTFYESEWSERDYTTFSGIVKTFANEIVDKNSELHKTWLEYINNTLHEVNDKYAKKILLMLSRNRGKEFARDEILKELDWSEDKDSELSKKLSTLIYGDLVSEGSSAYHYKGIADNVLYLIFYHKYQYEIYHQPSDIYGELYKKIEILEKDKKSLQARLNELKGRMLELVIWRELNKCIKKKTPIINFRKRLRPIISNNDQLEPFIGKLEKTTFDMVWMNYFLNSPATMPVEMDVLAIKQNENNILAIAFEIKNRIETHPPTMDECKLFINKINWLKNSLDCNKPIIPYGIYLSANGFSNKIEHWLHDHDILTVDLNSWEKNVE